ncbi:MAG: hypothetical protein WAL61_07930 [Acidimicrobiales bacterium]
MRGAGARARVLMWGLFMGAAAAVLAPVGPGALVPLKMAIASADSVGNDVYVAVVVDFGNGSTLATVSKCVPVASGAHDSDALAAAVGASNVAYAGSGLLCAIDNYPTNGVQNCGQSVGNGDYDYWSYWHGSSGSWVYGNNGPTEQSVSTPADDVEGLRYQNDEPASSNDPPPGVTPSYAQICNASTEVPPPSQASGPSPTTTTVASTTPVPATTPTTAKTVAGSGPATTTAPGANGRSRSNGASATSTTSAASSASGATTTTSSSATGPSNGTVGGSHGSSGARHVVDASAAVHGSSGGSSSDLVPVLLLVAVVVALGAFAFVRWRRRPADE